MRTKLLLIAIFVFAAQTALGWNATGHEAVAAVAWDNMNQQARARAITLLMSAPQNACLLDMLAHDNRPLKVRQREFFIKAATWPDVIRPTKDKVTGAPDTRECIQFHHGDWHFFDHFWSGTSGATGDDAPKDRPDIPLAATDAVKQLERLRPLVACKTAPCEDPPELQAMDLAWILHLVGDIHQPLHNAARVTTQPKELQGDRGGNEFQITKADGTPSNLHSFWDGIVDSSILRGKNEKELAYITRVATKFQKAHPKSKIGDLKSGDFNEWSEEGLAIAMEMAYPESLHRNETPSPKYKKAVFNVSDEAIARAGYRLADLLNSTLP